MALCVSLSLSIRKIVRLWRLGKCFRCKEKSFAIKFLATSFTNMLEIQKSKESIRRCPFLSSVWWCFQIWTIYIVFGISGLVMFEFVWILIFQTASAHSATKGETKRSRHSLCNTAYPDLRTQFLDNLPRINFKDVLHQRHYQRVHWALGRVSRVYKRSAMRPARSHALRYNGNLHTNVDRANSNPVILPLRL